MPSKRHSVHNMHARVTRYTVKADKVEEATQLIDRLRAEVLSSPGVLEVIGLERAGGTERMVVVLYQSRTQAEAAIPRALRAWHSLSGVMADVPWSATYEVVGRDIPEF